MFSLKNISTKFKGLKPYLFNSKSTFKPHFRSNIRSYYSSLIRKSNKSILKRSQYSFSTAQTNAYKCGKVIDINEELQETLNNNIHEIIGILPGRGINVSSFWLNRFLKMCYQKEPKVFEALYQNIDRELEKVRDQNTLISLAESFSIVKNSGGRFPIIPSELVQKLMSQVKKARPVIGEENYQVILDLLSVYKDTEQANLSELQELAGNKSFTIEDYLRVVDADALYEEVKDLIEIVNIDKSNNHIQIKYLPTEQVIDLIGCEPYPSKSLDHIVSFIKQNTGQINLLMMEDVPLFLQPEAKDYDFQNNFLEASESIRKDTELVHILEGHEMEHYLGGFLADQHLFEFDQEKGIVYTRMNATVKVPSELGTTTYQFYVNTRKGLTPKIILLDLSLQEVIGKMISQFSLQQLRELIQLLNYSTLIEKAYYADYCQVNGCNKCNPSMESELPLPKDMISIVAGDKELPLDFRTKFVARSIFDGIEINPAFQRSLVVLGSFHILDVLKEILNLGKLQKEDELDDFDRFEHLKSLLIDFRKVGSNPDETLEKLALLETVYQAIEMNTLQNFNPASADINFKKYMNFLDQYAYYLSYEKLAEGNREIKIRPGKCGAEELIFGLQEEIDKSQPKQGVNVKEVEKPWEEKEPEEEDEDAEPKVEEKKIKLKSSTKDSSNKKK